MRQIACEFFPSVLIIIHSVMNLFVITSLIFLGTYYMNGYGIIIELFWNNYGILMEL